MRSNIIYLPFFLLFPPLPHSPHPPLNLAFCPQPLVLSIGLEKQQGYAIFVHIINCCLISCFFLVIFGFRGGWNLLMNLPAITQLFIRRPPCISANKCVIIRYLFFFLCVCARCFFCCALFRQFCWSFLNLFCVCALFFCFILVLVYFGHFVLVFYFWSFFVCCCGEFLSWMRAAGVRNMSSRIPKTFPASE